MALQRRVPGRNPELDDPNVQAESPVENPAAPPIKSFMGMNQGVNQYDQPKGGGPGGLPTNDARGGETPRERPNPGNPNTGYGGVASPPRPGVPTPQAGAVSQVGGSTEGPSTAGLVPFQPLGGPSPSLLARPARRSLYGAAGGLQGGGLGVPLDPTSNQESDPISSLIQSLLKNMQGGGY